MNHYPGLLLVTSSHDAIWFHITEDTTERLFDIHLNNESFSDHEGQFSSNSAGHRGNPEAGNAGDKELFGQLTKAVAEKTQELWSAHAYRHLALTCPEQHKNDMQAAATKHAGDAPLLTRYGNHIKITDAEARALYKEMLKIHPK